jgi:prepilin-type N-terminal cleavage/methylation domain-containing protein
MIKDNKGFTLIELLVVVLIIGILAAVALPQYQKAVDKSRAAQVMPFLSAVQKAQRLYFLENGVYSDKWEDLSIGTSFYKEPYACVSGGRDTQCINLTSAISCELQSSGGYVYCNPTGTLIGFALSSTNSRQHLCISSNDRAYKLCQSLGGQIYQTIGNTNYFEIKTW